MNNTQSPRTDDHGIESWLTASGKTAARVTPADIEANIVSVYYFTGREGCEGASGGGGTYPVELGLLTLCVLVLRNGFTVTGESACASPENFDAGTGARIAYAAAVNKIWPLMGYALKTQLHQEQPNAN